jgi:mRNA-degrading endonuclease toxin of MazEF toxin-antitoxin module
MIKRRDVILVRVHFTDSSEMKVRPAIVVSDKKYHEDGYLLASAITTASDEYCMPISSADKDCQLDRLSTVRVDSIIKLQRKQVIKHIGRITPGFHQRLVDRIIGMIR